jgi:hypothetical protein
MKTRSHNGFKLWFDRLLSKSLWQQFLILGVVLLVALGLSYLLLSLSGAEWEKFCKEKDLSVWLLPIYLLIDSNALNNLYINGNVHGWMLFASSLTFLFGAFIFNGAIIAMITKSDRWVFNQLDKFDKNEDCTDMDVDTFLDLMEEMVNEHYVSRSDALSF